MTRKPITFTSVKVYSLITLICLIILISQLSCNAHHMKRSWLRKFVLICSFHVLSLPFIYLLSPFIGSVVTQPYSRCFYSKHPLWNLRNSNWHCISWAIVVLRYAVAKKPYNRFSIYLTAYNIPSVSPIIEWHSIGKCDFIYVDRKYAGCPSLLFKIFIISFWPNLKLDIFIIYFWNYHMIFLVDMPDSQNNHLILSKLHKHLTHHSTAVLSHFLMF